MCTNVSERLPVSSIYHGRQLTSLAVLFKALVWLCSVDDTVAATPEALSDEHSDPCLGGIVISVLEAAGDV